MRTYGDICVLEAKHLVGLNTEHLISKDLIIHQPHDLAAANTKPHLGADDEKASGKKEQKNRQCEVDPRPYVDKAVLANTMLNINPSNRFDLRVLVDAGRLHGKVSCLADVRD